MHEPIWLEIYVAAGLCGGMALVTEIGYQLGRCAKEAGGEDKGQFGTILGAILGLLGLLLGFSFASAGSRFIDRQDLIVQEANAIGTAYLRADLLEEPHRSGYRELLRKYADSRIRLSPLNEVIDLHATRITMMNRHLRCWLLDCSSVVPPSALGTVGYNSGLAGRRDAVLTTAPARCLSQPSCA